MAATSSLERAALEEHPLGASAPTTVGAVTRRQMPSPRRVFAISSLGVFVAFVDATIVNIAFPDIQRSFPEAGISTLSWVLSGYNIVFAAFLVAAGRLADLVGRKRTFVWGLGLFTLASGLCAIAPSAETLIACAPDPGARRRRADPVVAGARARGVQLRAPRARGRAVDGRRRARRRHRPAARRPARDGRPTGGSCSSSTSRSGSSRSSSAAATSSRAARRGGDGFPTCSARSCSRCRSRCSCSASSRDRTGAGPNCACSARGRRRSRSGRSSSAAAARIARRSSTWRCCASARSPSRTSRRSSPPRASSATRSSTSSS